MLLEKKVAVFQLKKWLLFGAVTLVFFLTVAITALDPIGITRYVPELNQVENVQISPYASQYYYENNAQTLTDEADIQEILKIHSQKIEDRKDGEQLLRLRYNLKNGMVVERQYYIEAGSEAGQTLKKFYSRFSYVVGAASVAEAVRENPLVEFHFYEGEVTGIHFDTGNIGVEGYGYLDSENWIVADAAMLSGLLEAIKKDCEAGNMAQNWDYHPGKDSLGSIQIQYVTYGGYVPRYADITVFPDCTNTVEYLNMIEAAYTTPEVEPAG
jgi:hypothetical protein